MPEIIRRDGNDPLDYTISRRGKKVPSGNQPSTDNNDRTEDQQWSSDAAPEPQENDRRTRGYEENSIMYR